MSLKTALLAGLAALGVLAALYTAAEFMQTDKLSHMAGAKSALKIHLSQVHRRAGSWPRRAAVEDLSSSQFDDLGIRLTLAAETAEGAEYLFESPLDLAGTLLRVRRVK